MSRSRSALRWLFEDRNSGRIVIAQAPNAAMWIALAALALSVVAPEGRAATATRIVLYLALVVWAFDEMARGVNPWRRALGAATLVGILVWLVILKR